MAEKEQVYRIRISGAMKEQFVNACNQTDPDIDPSTRLRMLIRDFIAKHTQRSVSMRTKIWRPAGYDLGAYRINIVLGDKEKKIVEDQGITFRIPKMRHRSFRLDDGYRAAVATEKGAELRGKFIAGKWDAHVYTNGLPENENPSSPEHVKAQLEDSIETAILPFIDL